MYESFSEPLASKRVYHKRVLNSGRFAILVLFLALSSGVLGYHYIAEMDWVDSFLNASMILSGMGVIDELYTDPAKIFAGCYALFSGVTFLSSMAVFLSPVIHRILHKLHISLTAKKD